MLSSEQTVWDDREGGAIVVAALAIVPNRLLTAEHLGTGCASVMGLRSRAQRDSIAAPADGHSQRRPTMSKHYGEEPHHPRPSSERACLAPTDDLLILPGPPPISEE